ncbi:MAG: hypothetical protein R2764_00515 [Bacteroidales bacterium]
MPGCGKVRDGRPIKIEGNELSKITCGGTNARVQASVLNLYDSARLQHPLKNGEKSDWSTVDGEIKSQLDAIAATGEKIVILSSSVISPSTLQVYEDFKTTYPTAEVVYYDTLSYSAMRIANEKTFDRPAIPSYRFDKVK